MPNDFWTARGPVIALAGFCLAPGLPAEESHSLRLMPRINVGNADATVSAAVLQGWETAAGFSLAPARKTLTGARIIDVPSDISAGRMREALAALRSDPGILWVDDKALPQHGNLPGYAEANRMTGQLVVRAKADAAAKARFAPGMTGSIAHRVLEASAVYEVAGYTVDRTLSTGHALSRLDTPVSFAEATALAASLSKHAMSLGAETGGCPDFLQEAIDTVVAHGAVVVVAAGNSQANLYDAAPAGCGDVIGVAAIGKGGDLTSYSNAGIKADIGASGGDSSEDPTESLSLGLTNLGRDRVGAHGYGYDAGTSFSAPYVADVLALMLSVNPDLAPGQMASAPVRSVRPYRQGTRCGAIIGNSECGAGMLDACGAAIDARIEQPAAGGRSAHRCRVLQSLSAAELSDGSAA